MTPDQATWVREHAWTLQMRRQPYMLAGTGMATYDAALAAALCDCMVGVCHHCKTGRHEFCHRRRIAPRPEWWISNRPTRHIPSTAVWLADRACRSLCPCCPDGPPQKDVASRSARPTYELVPLFGEVS